MKRFLTLMQREWLQHRFGWALLALVPIALALLFTGFGKLQLDGETLQEIGNAFPAMLAMGAISGTTALIFVIACLTSFIIVSGLARRDHADRSVEFWLSVPASHSLSLAAPLLVHLLLVPAAALGVGLLGGYAVSFVLVTHMVGAGDWTGLPWSAIVPASLALTLRVLAGLPLALLWLAPLVLLVVLLTAWFRRWAWVILAVGVGLGSLLMKQLFGQALLSETINGLLRHAAQALFTGRVRLPQADNPETGLAALQALPGWAASDFVLALRDLASPLLAGGLLFAAGCFALLVLWRQRGASAAS